jgi:hypothetical protein
LFVTGMLLALMKPPAGQEEDFFTWYEADHVPGRLSVPGFRSAARWRALGPESTGLLVYELDDLAVLRTPAYLEHQAATAQSTAARMGGLDVFVRCVAEVVSVEGAPGTGAAVRTLFEDGDRAVDVPATTVAHRTLQVVDANVGMVRAHLVELSAVPAASPAGSLTQDSVTELAGSLVFVPVDHLAASPAVVA